MLPPFQELQSLLIRVVAKVFYLRIENLEHLCLKNQSSYLHEDRSSVLVTIMGIIINYFFHSFSNTIHRSCINFSSYVFSRNLVCFSAGMVTSIKLTWLHLLLQYQVFMQMWKIVRKCVNHCKFCIKVSF